MFNVYLANYSNDNEQALTPTAKTLTATSEVSLNYWGVITNSSAALYKMLFYQSCSLPKPLGKAGVQWNTFPGKTITLFHTITVALYYTN